MEVQKTKGMDKWPTQGVWKRKTAVFTTPSTFLSALFTSHQIKPLNFTLVRCQMQFAEHYISPFLLQILPVIIKTASLKP